MATINSLKIVLFTITLFFCVSFKHEHAVKITYSKSLTTKVPEPSDVCLSSNGQSLFIVSDNGLLFETDLEGKILRKSTLKGIDFEGICLANNLLYISDESARKIYCVDPSDLSLKQTFNLNHAAGRNSGFESIAFDDKLKLFYLISEKEDIIIRVYNEQFQQVNEFNFDDTNDISSAFFYNNNLWVLSDEDHLIVQLDEHFKPIKIYDIKILNPEGFYFNKQGDLTVISDDMARLYQFEAAAIK